MRVTNPVTLSDLAAVLGMVLGTAGFVIGIMNYLRDRPKIKMTLKWDMTVVASNALIGILTVSNVGRRPIYISVASLKLPKGFKYDHLILKQSIPGTKLSEGDAPATFIIDNCAKLTEYSRQWRRVRGYAVDSAGKKYVSKKLAKSPVPSWVK